jgi:hypothetical protein
MRGISRETGQQTGHNPATLLNGRESRPSEPVQRHTRNMRATVKERRPLMKRFAKIALGAVMLAGAATAIASPASAGVYVGVGAPVAYGAAPACDPYSPYYSPYYCGYGPAYVGGPVIGFGFGGGWHGGGFHGGGFHGGGFHGGGFHGGGHR